MGDKASTCEVLKNGFEIPTLKPSSWAQAYTEAVLPTPGGPVSSKALHKGSSPPLSHTASPWKSPQSHESAREEVFNFINQKKKKLFLSYCCRFFSQVMYFFKWQNMSENRKSGTCVLLASFLLRLSSHHWQLLVSNSSTSWSPKTWERKDIHFPSNFRTWKLKSGQKFYLCSLFTEAELPTTSSERRGLYLSVHRSSPEQESTQDKEKTDYFKRLMKPENIQWITD